MDVYEPQTRTIHVGFAKNGAPSAEHSHGPEGTKTAFHFEIEVERWF